MVDLEIMLVILMYLLMCKLIYFEFSSGMTITSLQVNAKKACSFDGRANKDPLLDLIIFGC